MNGLTASRGATAGGLALAVVLLLPAQALGKTFVTRGTPDDTPVYKPRSFVAGSGVGGGVLRFSNVRWSRWGSKSAVGRGKYTYNICDPTCADGNYRSASARIRLYRPRRGCEIYQGGETVRARVRLFTRIELRYNGHTFRSLTSGTQSCQ
jgi:hypothetical protein